MISRIYIKELCEKLNCKDMRSIKRWCIKNGVSIMSDFGSKKKYVLTAEFEAKYDSQPKEYIENKFGKDKLPVFLQSAMNFFSEYKQTKNKLEKEYKPKGKNEKDFLDLLNNL